MERNQLALFVHFVSVSGVDRPSNEWKDVDQSWEWDVRCG